MIDEAVITGGEPFELVSATNRRVFILGRVRTEDSSLDELIIQADEGFTLAGSLVRTIGVTPRHVGDRFDALPDRKIIVNARAETEGEDIHFAGVVLSLPASEGVRRQWNERHS